MSSAWPCNVDVWRLGWTCLPMVLAACTADKVHVVVTRKALNGRIPDVISVREEAILHTNDRLVRRESDRNWDLTVTLSRGSDDMPGPK